jgi:hypothetical protein
VDPTHRNRALGALAVAIAVGLGWAASTSITSDVEASVAQIRSREQSPEQAQAAALAREHKLRLTADYFASKLAEDLEEYALAGPDLDTLKRQNAFEQLVSDPRILAPGESVQLGSIRLQAKIEKVTYEREGASVSARHALVGVTNVGDSPVGYFLRVRSADRGECKVRGSVRHNAMALLPGETADVAVCAGTGGAEILDLRTLTVTPIGYVYLGKLPPQTVGHDAVTARSHDAGRKVSTCSQVPAMALAERIRGGELQWQDVADFYSRHNCERNQFVDGYRWQEAPLAELPWRGAGGG